MARWTWVLTGNDYRPIGEVLNTYGLSVALPLARLDTASFRVRLDNQLADALLECRGYLKGYRNSELLYFGPIISAEESVADSSGTVAVNSVGAGWILNKRFAGKSATGDLASTAIDRATRFSNLLATANAEGDTGIQVQSASAASTVAYSTGPYKKLLTCLDELSAGDAGFDWRILPNENFADGLITSTKIGSLVAQPIMGVVRENTVFEHGEHTSHNIASYQRVVARDDQANKVYHNTTAGPDAPSYPTISAIDSSSITDWGLLEELAEADLLNSTMRTQLVRAHVDVRKAPRQRVDFTPIRSLNPAKVPQYGTDFTVGDQIVARAVRNGVTRWDGLFRVWGVSFEQDDVGAESMKITLTEDAA